MLKHSLSVKGHLVHTLTPDNLELQGFQANPNIEPKSIVFLFIHGMYQNATMPLFVYPMAEVTTTSGYHFLTGNTRAQDYFHYYRKWKNDGSFEWVQEGGSYEIFANCILDLKGWLNFCARMDKRVVLVGHSHGALKSVYYLAEQTGDSRVIGVILLSPSNDVGAQVIKLGEKYDQALEEAKTMMEGGHGRELMPEWVYGQPLTAEMYTDIFSANSDLEIFRFDQPLSGSTRLHSIDLPTLVVFGADDNATFPVSSEVALEFVEKSLPNVKSFTGHIVKDGNHNYIGKEEVLAQIILNWASQNLFG